jgi:uncharacterized protein (DUF924 family)/ribosomal protein S18 acetylase RimI-like enzyme
MKYELRDAVAGDFAAIEELLPRLAEFELPPGRRPEHLWSGDGQLYAAFFAGERPECIARVAVDAAGRVVGSALVTLRPEMLSGAPSAHLEALMIARSEEGRGLGRRLLDDASAQAAARGARSMTLHVFANNRRARRLYEGAGFSGEMLRYSRSLEAQPERGGRLGDPAAPASPTQRSESALPEAARALLAFWFGGDEAPRDHSAAEISKRQSPLWWQKNEAVDAEVKHRFEATLLAAKDGGLEDWLCTARGRLAHILLVDQVPRNIYRDTPAAFAFDARARALCKQGLESGAHLDLEPIERLFFYLPLEHSEDRSDQRQCVELFEELETSVAQPERETFANFTEFARRHREVIDRFGRFPHRNALLGRTNTVEEEAFLLQPGSSF